MTAQALAQPARDSTGSDVDHWYCCDPNVAYCGFDLSGVPEGREFAEICPLCRLAGQCPGCGGQ